MDKGSNHAGTGVLCIPLHCKGLDDGKVARYLSGMADLDPPPSKFAAYRARKKAAGFRELRMWVPDTRPPAFRKEAARQAALLDHSEDEREAAEMMTRFTAEAWDREP